ncbi:hypothetical protein AU468_06775 [Alkalispirochaeta sphaeroplastigenens]|uniref:SHSP domain-containing protein n=1 Tax=Alkalispirochaeta sphaeroplastigenens TaxID=1187066 RepID=A0A2S4JRZ4_9SPIO|nr:Hsp20 family protein [Alkalispirochaeta sphaeroplastigenens]POR02286.1 hypothetical protein AU468_06775 [Alkalispirochaeta sphaeroplastigenens]
MHNKDYLDLGQLFDYIFEATEELTSTFGDLGFDFRKTAEHRNYYSLYSFPPANIYMLPDKTMVFEFALAGYRDSQVSLEFSGDYMVLSAAEPETCPGGEEVIFFHRRLKLKAIPPQKYYVPEDKFDREQARAVFRNGILKVTVPSREEVRNPGGMKIEIVSDDD